MPPKGKGKKGKQGDNDEYWDKVGESATPSAVTVPPVADIDEPKPARKSAFTGLSFSAEGEGGGVDDDDDGDNLMAMLQKRKDKKKGKKKQKAVDFEDGPPPGQGSDGEDTAAKGDISAPQKPKEMTAEELADEEFGPVKEKKGKQKKGANKPTKEEKNEEDAAPETSEPREAPAPAQSEPAADEDGDDGDAGDGPKLLSKKEKEKIKKEKERAKKKAQAAAKKAEQAAGGGEDDAPAAAPAAAEGGAEDEDGEGAAASKNKKKKKKKKKGEEEEEEEDKPAPAKTAAKKGGGGGTQLAVLRAMMEERKRLEEEARRKQEEEQRRIEEEERRAAEEANRKEEEKLRKKEKEKAKKDQLRKEGKLLTPRQKAEVQAAERRRQALLASGAVIAGLAQGGAPAASGSGSKKVVYGKKKGPTAQQAQGHGGSQAASSAPGTPQSSQPVALPPPTESIASESVRSPSPTPPPESEKTWDEESGGEKAGKTEDGVKSDWDASSGEEDETAAAPPAKAAATPAPTAKGAQPAPATKSNGTTAKTAPAPAKAPASAKGAVAPPKPAAAVAAAKPTSSKSAAPPPEESEEESEEEEDSDDDDEDDSEEEDSEDEDDLTTRQRMEAERKAAAAARRKQREEEARAAASKENLRSPICCILGHVDTGKTKLLDKIRQTNVQEGEAGGITQQIGATYFPVEAIKTKTAVVNKDGSFEYKIPGLLIIDTPGHESFTNLRSRGSSLCNIAILVVDIMHGLEPQTIESLGLLKQGKTPFIIALNKIDRLYGWKTTPDNGVQDSLSQQTSAVIREFEKRSQDIIVEIASQGLNSEIYWKNKNPRSVVNIVPTSAITGEGIPDMIKLLVDLTQTRMVNSLMYISTLECTVLEVKVIEGLGTTIDVILSNGYLREGDKIVICGLNGPIITQVRALLTPQPLRELRIKTQYVHNKEVKAANGVKVVAPDLDKAIAGSKLLVCGPDDDEDDLMEEIMRPLEDLLKRISKTLIGVHVQASTLGSLEALLSFLEDSKIPVSGINIGPVHKKDVRRVMPQLEKAQEMACILCFDVPVDKEAEKLAEEAGIKLFKADIIYHLFDAFTQYNKEITEAKRKDAAPQAVWPCRLKIIAVFAKRDPIIVGVDIIEGTLRVGTPICVVKEKEVIRLGRITSLEINHKPMEIVKKSQAGGGVAVRIEHAVYETAKMVGRHFDENDELLSMISRQSIDVLKDTFRTDVSKDEWLLIKNLKGRLNIP